MSDEESSSRKSGYRVEYCPNNRAKCKGPKPCQGTAIPKGSLRHASVVDFQGHTTMAYRHWGCVTPKIVENMKKSLGDVDNLDGFEELNEDDQERLRKAWEDGHVAEEDISPTADKSKILPGGKDDEGDVEKPKRKRAPKKKNDEDDEDLGDAEEPVEKPKRVRKKKEENGEEKPKKATAKKPRVTKAKNTENDDGEVAEERPKPARAKKAAAPKAKAPAPAKKRGAAKKKDEEDENEDFTAELDEVDDDELEAEESAEETIKKRKAPASKASNKPASKRPKTGGRQKKSKAAVDDED